MYVCMCVCVSVCVSVSVSVYARVCLCSACLCMCYVCMWVKVCVCVHISIKSSIFFPFVSTLYTLKNKRVNQHLKGPRSDSVFIVRAFTLLSLWS